MCCFADSNNSTADLEFRIKYLTNATEGEFRRGTIGIPRQTSNDD